ncbi:maleylacetoacetate isomerase [Vibrio sp. T187]|uniref:maleylacetoacetate isomerase n=1 Tax=Vibrio TaxID=662 RepID=UPI0010C9DD11|nr:MULTISPECIES: maleylacetoacetate isomerase [Vibrio]MBW3694955.1 maleylacetoacetate isomerase [Vibrio sp. T187]
MSSDNGEITLYGYWRSSAAYRVRIVLNLKQIPYHSRSVHLVRDGGEQHSDDYHVLNPAELVPTLVHNDLVLNQSLAIIDYLEDISPQSSVYPDGTMKYFAKSIAQDVAIDIHPINNLRILQYLKGELGCSEESTKAWYQHWIEIGFDSVEEKLSKLRGVTSGKFALGDHPSIVDVCLVPQVYNALRFEVDMTRFPIIQSIWVHAKTHQAFIDAAPENQSDAAV